MQKAEPQTCTSPSSTRSTFILHFPSIGFCETEKGRSIQASYTTSTINHPSASVRPKGTKHPSILQTYTISHPSVPFISKKGPRNPTTPPIPHPSIISHPLGSVRPKRAPSILHTSTISHPLGSVRPKRDQAPKHPTHIRNSSSIGFREPKSDPSIEASKHPANVHNFLIRRFSFTIRDHAAHPPRPFRIHPSLIPHPFGSCGQKGKGRGGATWVLLTIYGFHFVWLGHFQAPKRNHLASIYARFIGPRVPVNSKGGKGRSAELLRPLALPHHSFHPAQCRLLTSGWMKTWMDGCPLVVPVAKLVTWAKHVRSPLIGPPFAPHPPNLSPRGGLPWTK